MRPIEELIDKAGAAEAPPALPEEGIPSQWLPSLIRWPVKIIFLPFLYLDLSMQKIARFFIRPPFKKRGKCKRRGNCCHYILIEHRKGLLGKLFYFWNTQIHGFYPRQAEPLQSDGKEVKVMGCRYLKENNRCAHYYTRPAVCRSWPLIETFGAPKILKGCGYEIIPRNEKSLLLLRSQCDTSEKKGEEGERSTQCLSEKARLYQDF